MSDSVTDEFALPPRRETFLARYPRNFKMAMTVVLLAVLILPPAWVHGQLHRKAEPADLGNAKEFEAENRPSVGQKVETDPHASALNDQNDRSIHLVAAPDVRVTEDTAEGSLPRISEEGVRPWQLYARPFNAADKRPRVSIVITGLGMSRMITDQMISQLPPTVTLSFNSQGSVVGAWCTRARQEGHEVLLQVPMEPFDYPRSDPGPDTLLVNLPNADNLARLNKSLRSSSGYVGITTTFGSRFTADSSKFAPVLRVMHDRGLMVLDSRIAPHSVVTDMSRSMGVPVATVTHVLDANLAPDAIAASLEDLEKSARQDGRAVGVAAATPVMLSQLQIWLKNLPDRGIALAPISSMVQ